MSFSALPFFLSSSFLLHWKKKDDGSLVDHKFVRLFFCACVWTPSFFLLFVESQWQTRWNRCRNIFSQCLSLPLLRVFLSVALLLLFFGTYDSLSLVLPFFVWVSKYDFVTLPSLFEYCVKTHVGVFRFRLCFLLVFFCLDSLFFVLTPFFSCVWSASEKGKQTLNGHFFRFLFGFFLEDCSPVFWCDARIAGVGFLLFFPFACVHFFLVFLSWKREVSARLWKMILDGEKEIFFAFTSSWLCHVLCVSFFKLDLTLFFFSFFIQSERFDCECVSEV